MTTPPITNTIERKYIVSYSGGLGSFMTAEVCRQRGYDFDLVFCDTHTEDPDLYRFLDDTAKYFGKEIIRISKGMNIWQVQWDVKFQANSKTDPCSRVLKREAFKKYVRKHYKPDAATILIGIGAREAHRTKDFKRNHAPYAVEAPLTDMAYSNEDICDILFDAKIEPPRLYEMGFPHNNCGGFCVKSGQKQAALLLKKNREGYLWHERKQEALIELMDEKHGTIRRTVKGVQYYLTLKEFREFIEQGGCPDMYEEGLCACF